MEGEMEGGVRQPVVLLVDDQPFFLTYHRNILTAKGFRVLTAPDGEEGLREAVTSRPDLIILDLEMPGLDGIEVCSRLKDGHSRSEAERKGLQGRGGGDGAQIHEYRPAPEPAEGNPHDRTDRAGG